MKTPTIYDIKYDTQEKSPYFFSRDTLKFFGQTMKSFKVVQSPTGRIFIYAPSYWDGRLMGYTFREYVDHNLLLPDRIDLFKKDDLNSILDYIQSH